MIGTELRDFRDFVLLPILALILPHRLWYRLMRACATRWHIHGSAAEQAYSHASRILDLDSRPEWLRNYRLTLLLDHADMYLLKWRGPRALKRRIARAGDPWPEQGAFMVAGFHYGTGLHVLVDMTLSGRPPTSLNRDLGEITGTRVLKWYTRFRASLCDRYGKYETTRSRSGYNELRQATARGEATIALLDVPPDGRSGGERVKLFGRDAQWRTGILSYCVKRKVPLYFFDIRFDRETGLRALYVQCATNLDSVPALAAETAERLQNMVARDSAAWMHWAAVDQFFRP